MQCGKCKILNMKKRQEYSSNDVSVQVFDGEWSLKAMF